MTKLHSKRDFRRKLKILMFLDVIKVVVLPKVSNMFYQGQTPI